MNFFESQDQARTNTFKLVWLFALAVVTLIVLTDFLVIMVLGGDKKSTHGSAASHVYGWVFTVVNVGVVCVVLIGSLYKMRALSSGGKTVAESLDGQLVPQNTDDLKLRKLLNVVEEMAIASGTPAPPVYLLANEPGINAFAAGFTPRDAVIGISRGAVDHLTREQLQGVIAHEFSHIFNGDMKLNTRLMGVLNGIEIIGLAGYYLLRMGAGRSRGNSKNGSQLVLLAFGLMAIGFAGSYFAGLIKSAVSRQREFLADASAVQFTRNPDGIAGALKRIGGLEFGSSIENPNAAEVSHAFFAQGVTGLIQSLSATHPPLEQRILKIDPQWNGKYETADIIEATQASEKSDPETPLSRDATAQKTATGIVGTVMADVTRAIDQIGKAKPETINHARKLIDELPGVLKNAARETYGARALVYSLLLDHRQEVRGKQFEYLQKNTHPGIYALMQKLLPEMDALDIKYRLPIIDLAIPSLKQMSLEQYQVFRSELSALIEMDARMDMLEWSLQKILFSHLDAQFFKPASESMKLFDIGQLRSDARLILSFMAYAGHQDPKAVEAAFVAAANYLGFNTLKIIMKKGLRPADLDQSLKKLENLKPMDKSQLLTACATCVLHDRNITAVETEVLRAFSGALGCPMPPIVP